MRSALPPEGAEFITIAQAAHYAQVSTETVRSWVRMGRIRRFGEGRLWRVRLEDLRAAMVPRGPTERPATSVTSKVESILRRAGG